MNKEIRKVKSISKNVLESVVYYSKFNRLYNKEFLKSKFFVPTSLIIPKSYLLQLDLKRRAKLL